MFRQRSSERGTNAEPIDVRALRRQVVAADSAGSTISARNYHIRSRLPTSRRQRVLAIEHADDAVVLR